MTRRRVTEPLPPRVTPDGIGVHESGFRLRTVDAETLDSAALDAIVEDARSLPVPVEPRADPATGKSHYVLSEGEFYFGDAPPAGWERFKMEINGEEVVFYRRPA